MKYKGYTITKATETYMENVGYNGIYSDKSDRRYEKRERDVWKVERFDYPFDTVNEAKQAIRLRIRKSSPRHEEYRKLKKRIQEMEKRLDKLCKWLSGETE